MYVCIYIYIYIYVVRDWLEDGFILNKIATFCPDSLHLFM